ncbi:MAG: hypothetical protein JRJ86_02220 [Deltaproteobacteria bacterium]|nr:hypothetical protein [Deltaproteobacteria bacterium]MBW2117049.1 hypothetical protein [Deltaproteobacteria bacterium]MBW2343115.1 hypothetical protein [Deltaproteobacteria bacterium]
MYNTNEDELLLRVYKYEVLRGEDSLSIDVCERIAGTSHHKFMAFPIGLLGKPEKEFVGFGETETEALRGCLNRIRNLSIKNIVEYSINSQESAEAEE